MQSIHSIQVTFKVILHVIKLCLHYVSIHRNFHQNCLINECFSQKEFSLMGLIWPSMIFEAILHIMKILCLYNVSIHIHIVLKKLENKNIRKRCFFTLKGSWPSMTFEAILHFMKNIRLHIHIHISNHRKFYQYLNNM